MSSRDLRESGYPFEFDWFAPHFEFRFPRIGDLEQRDLQIELRTALEPWHVLGEEPGGGGTVRYVDSSLERLQVKARGLTGDRFAIIVQRPSRAVASDRHQRRRRGGRALSRVAAAGMLAADHSHRTRRWCSMSWTPGTTAASAVAPIMSRIRADAVTTRSRSTVTKPSRGGWPGFSGRPYAGENFCGAGEIKSRLSFHPGFAQCLKPTTEVVIATRRK